MSDLISRQAAIDIIKFEDKWLFDAKSHNEDTKIAFSSMKSKISKLPSAEPSGDLISRQEAIEALGEEPEVWTNSECEIASRSQWLVDVDAIKAVPSAQPKKGKWIKRDSYDRRDNFYSCSICGRIINIICGAHLEDYPFCHCGADMRKE